MLGCKHGNIQCQIVPFADPTRRALYFRKHGAEFAVATEGAYEAMAERFMNLPLRQPVLECVRRNGDRVRFDPTTDEFGIARSIGAILSYYKPQPAVHLRPSNMQYFREQC